MSYPDRKFLKDARQKDTRRHTFTGRGHKLKDASPQRPFADKEYTRPGPSAANQAGIAALARDANAFGLSAPSFSKRQSASTSGQRPSQSRTRSSTLAVNGIYFKCPQIGPHVLTQGAWWVKMKEHFEDQLVRDKKFTPCIMIRTLNRKPGVADNCITALIRYLENIINNPYDVKFRQIRIKNPFFQENVYAVAGAIEFLLGAGFERSKLSDDGSEEYFVYQGDETTFDELELMIDALKTSQAISLELDRNIQVLQTSEAVERVNLPDEFYTLTGTEIKKEQAERSKAVELSKTLRTRSMREKEGNSQGYSRKYNFAIIRIRFPDGLVLQGTFGAYEKFHEVRKMVSESITVDSEYSIRSPLGHVFESADDNRTLIELQLTPATILTFVWEGGRSAKRFLKPEVINPPPRFGRPLLTRARQ